MCVKYFAWFMDFLKKLSKSDSFFKNVKNMQNVYQNAC